jgi:hypothetical protein
LVGVAGAAGIVACILADPPPIATPPPTTRPIIDNDLTTPRPGRLGAADVSVVAGVAQLTFVVVIAVDPDNANEQLTWRMLREYDPNMQNVGIPLAATTDEAGVTGQTIMDGGEALRIVTLTISEADNIDFSTCHTFTFVAATGWEGNALATPLNPPGGDSVTWTYEPLADCSASDAAPPIQYVEASTDGADE